MVAPQVLVGDLELHVRLGELDVAPIHLAHEHGSLERARDVAAQDFVGEAVDGARLENGVTELLLAEVEGLHDEARALSAPEPPFGHEIGGAETQPLGGKRAAAGLVVREHMQLRRVGVVLLRRQT